MWERLTAPEDGFSKLQRENLAIIESYGTALMEVVCRDACDGHEIGRVGKISIRISTLSAFISSVFVIVLSYPAEIM